MQSSGPVAQGIEHRIPNPGVGSSNLPGITIKSMTYVITVTTKSGIAQKVCPSKQWFVLGVLIGLSRIQK